MKVGDLVKVCGDCVGIIVAKNRKEAGELRKYFPMRYEGFRAFVVYKDERLRERWGEH
jgi:hypothetical protein